MQAKATRGTEVDNLQALEGKDVKDLLVNVGSGGGAAAPAAGGAAAAGGATDAPAAKEEEKEEGMVAQLPVPSMPLTTEQRRKSPTTIWASVSSTKRHHPTLSTFFETCRTVIL